MKLINELLKNDILADYAINIENDFHNDNNKVLEIMEDLIVNEEIIGYEYAHNWLMENGIHKFGEAMSLEIVDIEGIATYYMHQQAFEELDKYR